MPPGEKMITGRDGIEKYWKRAAPTVTGTKLTAINATIGQTEAHELGSFTARTKAARPREIAGKFVIVWRKVGDDWQVAADIWNSNN